MAYRWVVHNSALDGALGDGIIQDNPAGMQKESLRTDASDKINALWGPLKPK